MLNQIPRPVQVTLYKFSFLYVGIGILGALLSWAMSDFALLLLSIGVLIFGTIRAFGLLQRVRSGDYRVLDGTVRSDTMHPFRSCHTLIIANEYGVARRILVAGKHLLIPERKYRLYLLYKDDKGYGTSLPDMMAPAQTMLGYELWTQRLQKVE